MSASAGPQHVAWLSLGSNLQCPDQQIRTASRALAAETRIRVLAISSLYRTAPVGGPADQPMFCNAALAVATDLGPYELLAVCQAIEAAQGRVRDVRWGPRTLDMDIIAFDTHASSAARLTLPHPRAAERAFVLVPLAEIAPALTLGGYGRVIDCLAGQDTGDIEPWPAS